MRTEYTDATALRPMRHVLQAVRWGILIFVLAADWLVGFPAALVQRVPVMVSVAAIAVAMLVSQVAANRWRWLRRPGLALVADIVLVTVVTYFSDGIQSPFYPLYYITVILAAVDFGLSGALICAGAVAGISIWVDLMAATSPATGAIIPEDLVRTIPFLFMTALITGALRGRIRELDEAASAMRAQRAASDREMEVAARIQKAQLPLEMPTIDGVQIAVTYKPAREVGGDLYDFYPVHKDRVGFITADVSGKGVPAALLVSSAKYAVRESYSDDTGAMMAAINRHIMSVTTEETFVTMLYGVLCPRTREFRYINAGHMPPIVVKANDGGAVCLEHSDPPLGIVQSPHYTEQVIALDPGDTLVLYTDGVTDAMADADVGIEALGGYLSEVAGTDIDGWGDELLRRVAEPRHLDDFTMVAIRVE